VGFGVIIVIINTPVFSLP